MLCAIRYSIRRSTYLRPRRQRRWSNGSARRSATTGLGVPPSLGASSLAPWPDVPPARFKRSVW
jgi:hypothetical protein